MDKSISGARYIGFGGGYGNGKTLAACIKVVELCVNFKDNFFLVGRLKGTDLEASTKKTLLDLIAPWLESGYAEHKVKDNKIVFGNGSQIVFRHLEDVYASGISGMNLGGFYVDQAEETEESVFNTLTARLRRPVVDENGNTGPRMGILTFNMAGHNWIWRLFKKKMGKDKKPITNPEDFTLIEASTLDNAAHLPEDYLKDLMSKDKEWIARYVYGSWDVFAGQIFDDFDPAKHVVTHREPHPGSVIFLGIDPGYVDPFAAVWLAIEPGGQHYIFAEHYQTGKTTEWHAQLIRAISQKYHIAATYTDSAAAQVIADLNASGIYCIGAKKETLQSTSDIYTGGVTKLKELLKIDPVTKRSGIIISDRCVNLIYELQQYAWKQRKGEMNAPEVPEDKNNHAIDAVRYILLNYFNTPQQSSRPISMASAKDILATH